MFSQSDLVFDILYKRIKAVFPPLLQAAITNHFMQIWLPAHRKVINVLEEGKERKLFLLMQNFWRHSVVDLLFHCTSCHGLRGFGGLAHQPHESIKL